MTRDTVNVEMNYPRITFQLYEQMTTCTHAIYTYTLSSTRHTTTFTQASYI